MLVEYRSCVRGEVMYRVATIVYCSVLYRSLGERPVYFVVVFVGVGIHKMILLCSCNSLSLSVSISLSIYISIYLFIYLSILHS